MSLRYRGCQDCLRKAIEIDRLLAKCKRQEREIAALRKQLGTQHRNISEGPFGSSTSSAKRPVKSNSAEEKRQKRGGAKAGHQGHGRHTPTPDEVVAVPAADTCPDCGGELQPGAERSRTVLDAEPLKVTVRRHDFKHQRCRACQRYHDPVIPGVLPKAKLTNQLLGIMAFEHYYYGVPLSQLASRTGIAEGTLFNAMHQLADLLKLVPARLQSVMRQSPCLHADETPWRTDGANGYAWFFGNQDTSIFSFGTTRAGSVVTEVLGHQPLPGVLVVDRYAGYNVSPCARQYCYAHLLRDLQDLAKEFPSSDEVVTFVARLAPLLAEAMHLPGKPLSDADYYAQAASLKQHIQKVIQHSARHMAVQNYQNIFREHQSRLYHWVTDRRVPPDNNFAERAVRRTVIARKISFGSQSRQGAKTREILMTVLHTLAKRHTHPTDILKLALDTLVSNPKADLAQFLFPIIPPDP